MKNFVRRDCDRRIAIIGRLDQPGGVQSVILSLIKGLNLRGYVPDILWDIPPNRELLKEKSLQVNYQPIKFKIRSRFLDPLPVTVRYIFRVLNVIDHHQIPHAYDFYYIFYNGFLVDENTPHVRYLSGPPLLPQLDTYSPGLKGVPYQVLRGFYKQVLKKRFPVYEYHANTRYVINSSYTAQLFKEAHGIKLPIIHPPIDLQNHQFQLDDLTNRDTVTFFSRFADYKRPEMVLQLAARHNHMRFILMGGVKPNTRAYFESLRALANGLQNVEFIETPTTERIQEELSRTRFYVFPAINEHFGIASVEAIGSGAIPFVHDSGGQREIVPIDQLRFTDENFHQQFDRLTELPEETLNSFRSILKEHIERFSEKTFLQKMLSFIDG